MLTCLRKCWHTEGKAIQRTATQTHHGTGAVDIAHRRRNCVEQGLSGRETRHKLFYPTGHAVKAFGGCIAWVLDMAHGGRYVRKSVELR
jgi:hypothetical protein